MNVPSAITNQPQINAAITRVRDELAPDVVHIRYEIGQDWSGDWAIFFRILLSDAASQENKLHDITAKVRGRLSESIDFDALGVFAYFNFRSLSEQAELREPAWA